jgi:hypothetical protein
MHSRDSSRLCKAQYAIAQRALTMSLFDPLIMFELPSMWPQNAYTVMSFQLSGTVVNCHMTLASPSPPIVSARSSSLKFAESKVCRRFSTVHLLLRSFQPLYNRSIANTKRIPWLKACCRFVFRDKSRSLLRLSSA